MSPSAPDIIPYIMLEIDQTKLAFPKKELTTTLKMSDIPASWLREKNAIHHLHTPSGDYPVACFTSQLEVKPFRSGENSYFVCLGENEQERVAIACRDYLTLELNATDLTPIPEVMQTSFTPILSMLRDGEEVVLISNLDTIVYYLEQRSEAYQNAWNC